MKKEARYYDVFPRIVRAYSQTTITIHPCFDPYRFESSQTYRLLCLPSEGVTGQMQWPDDVWLTLTPQEGDLVVPCQFVGEQEYVLLVATSDGTPMAEFHLYALEDDLFSRRPYKGDTHLHTSYSDGKESPAYVAASCRRIGLDFMAITDHRCYAPSLEAQRAFEGLPTDLQIFPGEEVHPPQNRVHIVNFGGHWSINELFASQAYQDEVKALMQTLDLPAGMDRYPFASCLWCFDKIRDAGGLGVFCHPYWLHRQRCDVPGALTDLLFERQPFDALELIGGYHPHEVEANALQVARYHEERARGRRIPIVGASDSHGCETGHLFGWYYTLVFSPSAQLADLISSIKGEYAVAVEALPGEYARAHGPFRLARYALFLLREFYPLHDELCFEEGRLMLAYAAGDRQVVDAIQQLKGQTARLFNHWRCE